MRAALRSAFVVARSPAVFGAPASSLRLAGPADAVIACRRTIRLRSVTTPSAAPLKEPSREGPTPSGRFAWIDWYRGLACILMFQTHAYDAWTREPYRQGAYWDLARMQLGGFPARMFLMLAGVSLMLRYAGDARRGISGWPARRGAMLRGLEVLAYGLAFRLAEWLLGGAQRRDLPDLFKVDILNCIGVSLVLTALLHFAQDVNAPKMGLVKGSPQDRLWAPLSRRLEGRGVTIAIGRAVEQICYDAAENRVTGFALDDGSILEGDVFVSAMPVHSLRKRLAPALRRMPHSMKRSKTGGRFIVSVPVPRDNSPP